MSEKERLEAIVKTIKEYSPEEAARRIDAYIFKRDECPEKEPMRGKCCNKSCVEYSSYSNDCMKSYDWKIRLCPIYVQWEEGTGLKTPEKCKHYPRLNGKCLQCGEIVGEHIKVVCSCGDPKCIKTPEEKPKEGFCECGGFKASWAKGKGLECGVCHKALPSIDDPVEPKTPEHCEIKLKWDGDRLDIARIDDTKRECYLKIQDNINQLRYTVIALCDAVNKKEGRPFGDY